MAVVKNENYDFCTKNCLFLKILVMKTKFSFSTTASCLLQWNALLIQRKRNSCLWEEDDQRICPLLQLHVKASCWHSTKNRKHLLCKKSTAKILNARKSKHIQIIEVCLKGLFNVNCFYKVQSSSLLVWLYQREVHAMILNWINFCLQLQSNTNWMQVHSVQKRFVKLLFTRSIFLKTENLFKESYNFILIASDNVKLEAVFVGLNEVQYQLRNYLSINLNNWEENS